MPSIEGWEDILWKADYGAFESLLCSPSTMISNISYNSSVFTRVNNGCPWFSDG